MSEPDERHDLHGLSLELDEALLALDELGSEDPEDAITMFGTLPEPVQQLPAFVLALARLHQASGALKRARKLAETVITTETGAAASPGAASDDQQAVLLADAHHLLGDVLEDLDEPDLANQHFLSCLQADEKLFKERSGAQAEELRDRLAELLEETVQQLPEEVRPRIQSAERKVALFPSAQQVKKGMDPRALGVWLSEGSSQQNQLVLFAANVEAEYGDLDEFGELVPQVRQAIFDMIIEHLGLNEPESQRLGLLENSDE